MARALRARGPDDCGEFVNAEAGIAMAHRRLSVLELSEAGHQPMVSASGRFVIVFNGEIYNHEEIRLRLEKKQWKGHSDTEVLLEAIDAWGLEPALRAARGMFAFALWNTVDRELFFSLEIAPGKNRCTTVCRTGV